MHATPSKDVGRSNNVGRCRRALAAVLVASSAGLAAVALGGPIAPARAVGPCVLGVNCPPPPPPPTPPPTSGGPAPSGAAPGPSGSPTSAPGPPCRQPAARARGMELAIQDDTVFVYGSLYDRARALAQIRDDLHASALRMTLTWAEYKRSGFRRLDSAVAAAAAAGIRVQLTVAGTPEFDPGGDQFISFQNATPNRVATFMQTVARHFKGCVTRYSVWNEPNLPRWINGRRRGDAARTYRNLYRRSYAAIKSVDRRNQVLIGELTSAHDPLGFLSQVARGDLRADGLAYHPFQFSAAAGARDPSRGFTGISHTPQIRGLLNRLRRGHRLRTPRGATVPIYFTEFAYLQRGVYKMPESRRRSWAVQAARYARRQHVAQFLWYMFAHAPPGALNGDIWDSGIIGLNGRPDSTYTALRRARRSIAGF